MAQTLEIAMVTHDIARRRSLLLLTWPDDPERRLSLPIPFDTPLSELPQAASAAIDELVAELRGAEIVTAGRP